MTLLSAWALAGLVLLVPLVLAHVRSRHREVSDVSSLLLWEGLEQQSSPVRRRLRPPPMPLLLALQALALLLLVVALARPAASASARPATHVYVLDDSLWMGVGGRLASAESRIEQLARTLPRSGQVAIVVADALPRVIYRGPAAGVSAALARVAPDVAAASLTSAMSLVAGLLGSAHDRVALLRSPEDPAPAVRASQGELKTLVVGSPLADQGIFSPSARCGVGGGCEVLATVSNTAATATKDRWTAYANGGGAIASGIVHVGARSSADLVLPASPGKQLRLQLDVHDALPIDDQAWVSVPGPSGAPPSATVTLVGTPIDALGVARAFAAVPGVTLRLRTPASYRTADARDAELTVVDGRLPPGGVPPSPAVALIDPSRLPGGRVGPISAGTPRGEDATNNLLSGVDLSSLAITPGAARTFLLPSYLTSVVWSPSGALLATGDDGRRRLTVLAFDPAQSDLPQLASFPILASNLVRWAAGWAPSSAPLGEPLRIDATPGAHRLTVALDGSVVARRRLRGDAVEVPVARPGLYTVTETGPGVRRRATIAVSTAAATAAGAQPAPIDLTATRVRTAPGHGPLRAPWLLGAALAILVLEWGYWRLRSPVSRLWLVWAAMQCGAVALLAAALANPHVGHAQPETVLVIDRSASIDAGMRATEDAWVRDARRARCPAPCRVVEFALSAQPLPPSPGVLTSQPPPRTAAGATNIETAVDTAVGLLPRGGRVVVLSDGLETTGDAQAAAARARSAGVELDFVRLSDPSRRDAAITQIHAPAAVHAGDPLPLQVTIRSTVAGPATLSIERDGVTIGSRVVNLRASDNPLLLTYTAPGPGSHSFAARIALRGDSVPADDALATTVDVVRRPRVLVVSTRGAAVASTLQRAGLAVTTVAPTGLSANAAALGSLDALVLDDVPAAALHRAQVAALSRAVTAGGLGLAVLGGPHSFSLGGYARTTLERLLPVASLVPGNLQRRNVAIELVLDHSGSMIDLLGGIPKIDAVRAAGAGVARFIAAHHDDLGVIDFDAAPHVLIGMQALSSGVAERNAIARIQGLQASGGTNIYAALKASFQQLELSRAPDKHMILITDGISEAENYAPLLATLRRDHVRVATVALGSDADKALLRRIASATGGDFYDVTNAHELPGIFAKETRLSVQPVKVTGRLAVTIGADSPVIRSLAGMQLLPLTGNVITTLKPNAQSDLLAAGPSSRVSPALAQWQDGAGRVIAFTPGYGGPFASDWTREMGLWNDATRWVERGVAAPLLTPTAVPGAPPSLQIDLGPAGTRAFAVSRLAGTLGTASPVGFARVGPSLYETPPESIAPGVYGFRLDAQGTRASGVVALPYSLEYLPRPAGDTPLGALAALTGGHQLGATQTGSLTGEGRSSLWWALTLAALALFVASALGRQLEDYTPTSPASLADPDSSSSTGSSVGAAM